MTRLVATVDTVPTKPTRKMSANSGQRNRTPVKLGRSTPVPDFLPAQRQIASAMVPNR